MNVVLKYLLPGTVCWAFLAPWAVAQDFHVYTTVYNDASTPPRVIARSLSLFHGGKTYDFVHEVGEVIVFEPAARRFTLLNTRQMKAATVLFEELNGQLKVARETLEQHLAEFSMEDAAQRAKLYDQLRFQLEPQFKEERGDDGRLVLSSPHMQYRTRIAPINAAEKVNAYLHYADWMCRLNYVLHPGPLLPEPRLALNASLRKAQAIPTEVELIADVDQRIHLRAEHKTYWNLDDKDRELIHQWEQLLRSKDLQNLTFQEYQRSLLVSEASRRK